MAAVVFTDIVASTELRTAVGDEVANRIRRRHDHVLGAVVAAGGGRVIKTLGDGIMATFASASDAVSAAVSMQQAVDRLARRWPISIRVAVAAGDVTFEADDCFGIPVIEAARLVAVASGGQVLCSDLVRAMAGRRDDVLFEGMGERLLKGLGSPVGVWEVGPAAPVSDRRVLVGRAPEREQLLERVDEVAAGSGGLVWLVGEPGIGKTRLLEEVAAEAEDAGCLPVWGRCYDGEAVPLGPWIEVLEAIATDPAVMQRLPGWAATSLQSVSCKLYGTFSSVDVSVTDLPSGLERQRLHAAFAELTVGATTERPLVVLLDDLHWADASSVDLLRAIARRAHSTALLVVGAYRDTDLHPGSPLAAALGTIRREAEPTTVTLRGLSVDEVGRLAASIAGRELAPQLVAAIAAETAGNPFFARETVRHLADADELSASSAGVVPLSVREVIGTRVRSLSPTAQALLSAAAAFEGGFPLTLVAEIAGLDDEAALDAVDESLAAHLLAAAGEVDVYHFAHDLVRHTLYDALNPSRRARLHRRVATRLSTDPAAEPATVMHHWHRSAALPGRTEGVAVALAAAEAAARRLAFPEEVRSLSIAIELLEAGDARGLELRQRLVLARASAGDHALALAGCVDLLPDLSARASDVAAADVAAAVAGRLEKAGGDPQAVWQIAALGMQYVGARRDRTWVLLRAWELEAHDHLDPDNPGIPLETPERRELSDVARQIGESSIRGLLVPTRTEALHEIETLSGSIAAGLRYGVIGDVQAALPLFQQAAEHARTSGLHGQELVARGMLGRAHLVLGHFPDAREVADEGRHLLDLVPVGSNPWTFFRALEYFDAWYHLDTERLQVAAGSLWRAGAAAPAGMQWLTAPLHAILADGWTETIGKVADQTEQRLPALWQIMETAPGSAWNYAPLVCSLAGLAWWAERPSHAADLARNIRLKVITPDTRYGEWCGRHALARSLALAGRLPEARRWFSASRFTRTEQGALPFLAMAEYDEALMEIRQQADLPNARRRLDSAAHLYEQLGLTSRAERAASLLQDAE